MTSANIPPVSWEKRAADRSPSVQRSRMRTITQAKVMLDAALRLIRVKGDEFTTQELVKEAGVALQTFYRYFSSKDELLLAVIAYSLTEACERWAEAASPMPDPLVRPRFYVTSTLDALDAEDVTDAMPRFVVSTHWRLHRIFPEELADAEKPVAGLLLTEINACVDEGLLHPANPEWAAWFIAELVRTVYHDYVYASKPADEMKDQLWQFCLMALGGTGT